MRAPRYPWDLCTLLNSKPNLGWLMDLCEENYRHIMRLAPELRALEGQYISHLDGAVDLHLNILEQTRYTTLIHLTYYFSQAKGHRQDPDARVRIYHDSTQAELLELRQHALQFNRGLSFPTLAQKWRANLFLSKWLSYCILEGHSFHPVEAHSITKTAQIALVESC